MHVLLNSEAPTAVAAAIQVAAFMSRSPQKPWLPTKAASNQMDARKIP